MVVKKNSSEEFYQRHSDRSQHSTSSNPGSNLMVEGREEDRRHSRKDVHRRHRANNKTDVGRCIVLVNDGNMIDDDELDVDEDIRMDSQNSSSSSLSPLKQKNQPEKENLLSLVSACRLLDNSSPSRITSSVHHPHHQQQQSKQMKSPFRGHHNPHQQQPQHGIIDKQSSYSLDNNNIKRKLRTTSTSTNTISTCPGDNNNQVSCWPNQSHHLLHHNQTSINRVFRVWLFVNGDRHFSGINFVLNLDRFRTMDTFCAELSRVLIDVKSLPCGVRIIFDVRDGTKLNTIEQFRHNQSYVCSSTEHFIRLDYHCHSRPFQMVATNFKHQSFNNSNNITNDNNITMMMNNQQLNQQRQESWMYSLNEIPAIDSDRGTDVSDRIVLLNGSKSMVTIGGNGGEVNSSPSTVHHSTSSGNVSNAVIKQRQQQRKPLLMGKRMFLKPPAQPSRPSNSSNSSTQTLSTVNTIATTASSSSTATTTSSSQHSIFLLLRPKLVALLRGSCRAEPSLRPSRRVFRFLLNHRVAQNYEQFLNEISKCVKLNIGAVYRIHSFSSGKKITCIPDLLDSECIYLVYGRSEKRSQYDYLLDDNEQREIVSIVGSSAFFNNGQANFEIQRKTFSSGRNRPTRKVVRYNECSKNSDDGDEDLLNSLKVVNDSSRTAKKYSTREKTPKSSGKVLRESKVLSLPRNFLRSVSPLSFGFDEKENGDDSHNNNRAHEEKENLQICGESLANNSRKRTTPRFLADTKTIHPLTGDTKNNIRSSANKPNGCGLIPNQNLKNQKPLSCSEKNNQTKYRQKINDRSSQINSNNKPSYSIGSVSENYSSSSSGDHHDYDSCANYQYSSSNFSSLLVFDFKMYGDNNNKIQTNNNNNSSSSDSSSRRSLTKFSSDDQQSTSSATSPGMAFIGDSASRLRYPSGSSTPGAASSVSCSEDFSYVDNDQDDDENDNDIQITESELRTSQNRRYHRTDQNSNKRSESEDFDFSDSSSSSSSSSTPSFSSLSCARSIHSHHHSKLTAADQQQDCLLTHSNTDSSSPQFQPNSNDSTPKHVPQQQQQQQQIAYNNNNEDFVRQNEIIKPVAQFKPKDEVNALFYLGNIIGDGKFGIVYTCIDRKTGYSYAMKVVDKLAMQQVMSSPNSGQNSDLKSSNNNGGNGALTDANLEAIILRRLDHPNIVRLYNHFDYVDECYLVLELMKGGDLFDAITTASRYSEMETAEMITDLINAIDYLHKHFIVHRDIKLENLMISFVPITQTVSDTNGSNQKSKTMLETKRYRQMIKLADFGLAVEVQPGEQLFTVCGTPTYVAPEILLERGYSFPVDVWAAGVIMYILLSGFPPFVNEENNQDLLFDQILSGRFDFNGHHWRNVSDDAKTLILSMLCNNPNERITAEEVLVHAWLLNFTTLL